MINLLLIAIGVINWSLARTLDPHDVVVQDEVGWTSGLSGTNLWLGLRKSRIQPVVKQICELLLPNNYQETRVLYRTKTYIF